MLVLQSCTDSPHILAGSSIETFPTSPDGGCNYSNTEFEEDVVVIEEGFTPLNEEVAVHIKEELYPENFNFPLIKSEPDEVSSVCICVLSDIFFMCPETTFVFVTSLFLAN